MATGLTCKDYGLFFGCRKGAEYLASLLCRVGRPDQPCNDEKDPDTVKQTPLYCLMTAKNYKKEVRGTAEDNDVHQDFADFIIGAGLWHRSIDEPTGVSGLGEILDEMKQTLERLVNTPNDALNGLVDDSKTPDIKNLATDKLRNLYDLLVRTIMLSAGVAVQKLTRAGKNDVQTTDATTIDVGINSNNAAKNKLDKFVDEIIKNAHTKAMIDMAQDGTPTNKFGKLLAGLSDATPAEIDTAIKDPNPGRNLMGVLRAKGNKSKYSLATNEEKTEIDDCLNTKKFALLDAAIIKFVKNIYFSEWDGIATFFNPNGAWDVVVGKEADLKTYLEKRAKLLAEDANRKNEFINFVFNEFATAAKKCVKLYTKVFKPHTYPTKTEASHVFASKLNEEWEHMLQSSALKFYNDNVNIMKIIPGGNEMAFNLSKDGSQSAEFKSLIENLDSEEEKYRINLKKMRKDPQTRVTFFNNKLPFLPDATNHLWYTNNTNTVVRIDANRKTIRDLYYAAYSGENMVNGQSVSLPTEYKAVDNGFRIDPAEFIRCYIQGSAKNVTQSQDGKTLDQLLPNVDMITGAIIQCDKHGIYRLIDGKTEHEYYGEVPGKGFEDKCYGSGLHYKDHMSNEECEKLVRECLLGDPSELGTVLEQLRNQDLFTVAQKEFSDKDVHPNIALRILKRFNFKTHEVNGRVMIESYEHWEQSFLDLKGNEDIKKVLVEKPGLAHYLKGVVCFVNKNPLILNPCKPGETPKSQHHYSDGKMEKLDFNYYVEPRFGTPAATLFSLHQLRNNLYSYPFSPPSLPSFFNAASNAMVSPNVMYPAAAVLSRGGGVTIRQSGGGNEISSAGPFKAYYAQTLDVLQSMGYNLSARSKKVIEDAFKNLCEHERRLNIVMSLLRAFADLAQVFGSTGCVPVGNRTISLESLINERDNNGQRTVEYLHNNINNLQSCLSSNMISQNNQAKQLLTHFVKLTESALGKHDPNEVRVMEGYADIGDPLEGQPRALTK